MSDWLLEAVEAPDSEIDNREVRVNRKVYVDVETGSWGPVDRVMTVDIGLVPLDVVQGWLDSWTVDEVISWAQRTGRGLQL